MGKAKHGDYLLAEFGLKGWQHHHGRMFVPGDSQNRGAHSLVSRFQVEPAGLAGDAVALSTKQIQFQSHQER